MLLNAAVITQRGSGFWAVSLTAAAMSRAASSSDNVTDRGIYELRGSISDHSCCEQRDDVLRASSLTAAAISSVAVGFRDSGTDHGCDQAAWQCSLDSVTGRGCYAQRGSVLDNVADRGCYDEMRKCSSDSVTDCGCFEQRSSVSS